MSPSGKGGLQWDGASLGPWIETLAECQAVINLSGAPITLPWNAANKDLILKSRVDSTRAIARALQESGGPKIWINGSAVGYYGDRADEVLTESSPPGKGFLSEVCLAWESAMEGPNLRKVQIRTGIALAKKGGALEPLKGLTEKFLGGAQGSGDQWMPWIHIDDLAHLFVTAIDDERYEGPINGSAPSPVRNAEFMAELRHVLKRPWSPPAPAFAVKLGAKAMGVEPTPIFVSERTVPEKALALGFQFGYTELRSALENLLG